MRTSRGATAVQPSARLGALGGGGDIFLSNIHNFFVQTKMTEVKFVLFQAAWYQTVTGQMRV